MLPCGTTSRKSRTQRNNLLEHALKLLDLDKARCNKHLAGNLCTPAIFVKCPTMSACRYVTKSEANSEAKSEAKVSCPKNLQHLMPSQ